MVASLTISGLGLRTQLGTLGGIMAVGQVLGYQRVSTTEQNQGRQLEGVKVDRMFTDKLSGKDTARPQLQELLAFCREGDTIVVHSLDRLARNLDDLRKLVSDLTGRGVQVRFLKEGLNFTGEDSSMSKLLLSVMGAFAEFERSLILERQAEGIALAKTRGVYKGRKPSLDADQAAELVARVAAGEPKAAIGRDLGISRETVYAYMKRAPQPALA